MILVHYVLNILLQVARLSSSVLNNKRPLFKYSGARNLNDENSVFAYLGAQWAFPFSPIQVEPLEKKRESGK